MVSISKALATAVKHHQAGNLAQAEETYRQILDADPNCADALHLLGVASQQSARHQEAVDWIQQAIAVQPKTAAFHKNLGVALRHTGQLEEAVASYQRALEIEPDNPETLHYLGMALKHQGKLDEAVHSYRRAIESKPSYYQAYSNLGIALHAMRQYDHAIDAYSRAIELNPRYAEAWVNLGKAKKDSGQLDEAIKDYNKAIELKPDLAEAYNNLGSALDGLGRTIEAFGAYNRAVQINPASAEAQCNLASALERLGRVEDAIQCYQRALSIKPDNINALHNLGNTFRSLERLDEAVDCYRQAIQFDPDNLLCVAPLTHLLQHLCDWKGIHALEKNLLQHIANESHDRTSERISPFTFIALHSNTSAEQQLRCAKNWVEIQLKLFASNQYRHENPVERASDQKIVVGYLSADFHSHATSRLIVELFERHNREQFEIRGYSYGPDDDSVMRRRVIDAFDEFVDLSQLSHVDAADRIYSDRVDILVDLKGYTQNARTEIMALRPAPIQINYLGYPGTMGAEFMDYILVDEFVVPADQQPHFTEKLIHLPRCYQINDGQREIDSKIPSRHELNLPEEGFVFCCFNNSYKITPTIFDVWTQLLRQVEGSVLWLLEGNAIAPTNLRREAEARGVQADRLVFAAKTEPPQHLARHALADLFLDTFPVTAHTTASDALWCGLPLLTIAGETFVSRVAGSLLHALGLSELVATTVDEYKDIALKLARDPDRLARLRESLAMNRETSGVFDAGKIALTIEQIFRSM